MTVDAIDCQGLGGGMTLGFVQAGAHLVRKVEQKGNFGFAQMDANRHLLGYDWDNIQGVDEWEPRKVPLVFGNPPCSGFSMLSVRAGSKTRRDYRGPEAAINSCMWDLVEYAAKCEAEVVVMESVPTAGKEGGKGGRELMRKLRLFMESLTGEAYDLHHCFHNNLALGGSSRRPRYFMVLSRIPFGASYPDAPELIPTMRDIIGDIDITTLQPGGTLPYSAPPTWWSASKRTAPTYPDTFTGGFTYDSVFETAHAKRMYKVIQTGMWDQGRQMVEVLQAYYEKTGGEFPDGWDEKAIAPVLTRPIAKGEDYDAVLAGEMTREDYCLKWRIADFPPSKPQPWQGGAYQPRRWRENEPALVMAGNALTDVIHPWRNRTLTYREGARIMGFPDDWNIDPYWTPHHGSHCVFGKGVVVESGRWIGDSAIKAINGTPYENRGELVGEREYLNEIKAPKLAKSR